MNPRRQTKEGVTVERGQVWHDLDPRMLGRRCVVVGVEKGKAYMQHCDANGCPLTQRITRVFIARMHKHSTGWALAISSGEK